MNKKNKVKRKPYRFGVFARAILKQILPRKYNINFYVDPKINNLEPPYFIIANHTSFFDPFIVGLGNKDFVNHVANDEYFRYRILAFFMRMLGAIPKTKQMTDYSSVRNIYRLKEQNDVICIFAEGGRTWEGETQPLILSTSKLIKKLAIPVVTCVTKGGSLSFPRWGKKFRKGKIDTTYQLVLTSDDIKKLSFEEIHNHLSDALKHNETEWNRIEKIPFKGRKLAEHLEWFIYACPKCGKLESMKSHQNHYSCQCGYRVIYTQFGLFESDYDGEVICEDLITWNKVQKEILKKYINNLELQQTILEKNNVALLNGKRRKRELISIMRGKLIITKQNICLINKNETRIYEYDKIKGVITNHKNVIDFYYENDKIRFELFSNLECGYIIEDIIKIVQENQKTT